jgi:UDP-N-acetylglucosamine:LPS N-acetylglucosamine transferase
MAEAIHAYYPREFETDIREIMQDYGFTKDDTRHKEFWRWALEQPWRARLGQRVLDHFPWATNQVHRGMLHAFAKEAAMRLTVNPPQLVIANHPWLVVALTLAQQQFKLNVPVLTFQTSTLDASALWAEPNCERIVLGGQRAKTKLVRMGVPEDKIDVVGYPVRQAILQAPSQQQARAKLGLDDRFTCLIVLGGEGVGGNPEAIVDTLTVLELNLQLVVICGRNEPLERTLNARQQAGLHVVGYTDNMADYLAASSVVIGKTGPTAVLEALAVGRPVLAPSRSGGVETIIIDVLASHGLGGLAPLPEALKDKVRKYYQQPDLLEAVTAKTTALNFEDLTRRLTDYIVHYARTGQPDTSLRSEGLQL